MTEKKINVILSAAKDLQFVVSVVSS